MFRSIPLFVAFRFFHPKGGKSFSLFASVITISGIALSVGTLITVLSVVNGFEDQMHKRMLGMVHHITAFPSDSSSLDWGAITAQIKEHPQVLGASPFVAVKGILQHEGKMQAVQVQGIDPVEEGKVSTLSQYVVDGKYESLRQESKGVMLGKQLADHLNLTVGDKVSVIVSKDNGNAGILSWALRTDIYTVVAIYSSGTIVDKASVFTNIKNAADLGGMPVHAISGIHVKLKNIFNSRQVMREMYPTLPPTVVLVDWMEEFGILFNHIATSKRMVFLCIVVVLLVACFNVLSTLLVTLNRRAEDIVILRIIGAKRSTILASFTMLGMLFAITGVSIGIVGGVVLSLSLQDIYSWTERTFGLQLLNLDVYPVNFLSPVILETDILIVSGSAFLLTTLLSIYPAWKASVIDPAKMLKTT